VTDLLAAIFVAFSYEKHHCKVGIFIRNHKAYYHIFLDY